MREGKQIRKYDKIEDIDPDGTLLFYCYIKGKEEPVVIDMNGERIVKEEEK